jgi:hypothetical protein
MHNTFRSALLAGVACGALSLAAIPALAGSVNVSVGGHSIVSTSGGGLGGVGGGLSGGVGGIGGGLSSGVGGEVGGVSGDLGGGGGFFSGGANFGPTNARPNFFSGGTDLGKRAARRIIPSKRPMRAAPRRACCARPSAPPIRSRRTFRKPRSARSR